MNILPCQNLNGSCLGPNRCYAYSKRWRYNAN